MSRRRSRSETSSYQPDLTAAALLVALMAIPVYFNAQSGASYEPDKGALLRMLALLAAVPMVITWLQTWRSGEIDWRSRMDWSLLLLAGIVLAVGMATLFGVDAVTSLWGNYDRGHGWLSSMAWAILIVAAYLTARRGGVWLLVDAVALSAAVPALYGLLQVAGFDPVLGQSISFVLGQRASASLGNPLFLGDFLLLAAILVSARILVGPTLSRPRRLALAGYLALLAVVLFATASRSAYLGVIVAVIFFLLAWGHAKDKRWVQGAGLLVAAAGGLLLLLAWTTPHLLPARLSDLFASGGTGGQRLLFWQAVFDLIRSAPWHGVLGIGPDAMAFKLAPHLPATLAHFEPDWAFRIPDRAHSLPLDLLSDGGVLGLGLFTLFWACLIARLTPTLRHRRSTLIKILLQVAGALLVAGIAALLAGIATAPLGYMAGFLAGALIPYVLAAPTTSTAHPSSLAPFLLAALTGRWLLLGFSFTTHAPDLVFAVVAGLALLEPADAAAWSQPAQPTAPARRHRHLAGIAAAVFAFSLAIAWPTALPLWLAATLLLALLAAIFEDGSWRAWLDLLLPTLLLFPALWLNRFPGIPAWLTYTWFLLWLLGQCVWLLPQTARRQALVISAIVLPIALLLNLPVYGDIALKSALLTPGDSTARSANLDRAFLLSPHDHMLAIGIVPTENQSLPADAGLSHPQAARIIALYERALTAQPLAPEPSMLYAEWLRQRANVDPTALPLALAMFARGLALSPHDIQARNHLALLRAASGDEATADRELVDLLALDPLYGPTYLNLAELQRRMGDEAGARDTLTAGVERVFWWPELQQALDALP